MKVELVRLRLNQGGYTDDGRYYGVGAPLYQYRLELPDSYSCYHRARCSEPDLETNAYQPMMHCPECGVIARRETNDVCEEIRASGREHAKEMVRRKYPQATFYR